VALNRAILRFKICLVLCAILGAWGNAIAQESEVFEDPRLYPALFLPGVTDSALASIVQLAAGDSAGPLLFSLAEGGGTIEGRIFGAEGGVEPRGGVLVRVTRGSIRVLARSEPDGRFRVSGVPAGEAIVRYATDDPLSREVGVLALYHPGTRDSMEAARITVTEGQVTALPDVALPAASILEGSVDEAAGGGPVGDLEVFALSSEGRQWSARTGPDGSFLFGGLAAGLYTIHVDPRDGLHAEEYLGGARRAQDAEWAEVGAGERRTGLNLSLDPGGEIRGVVRRSSDGTGLVGATVEATNLETGRVYRTETYTYGFYVIPALPAGAYLVYVPALDFYYPNTRQIEQARPVPVVENETAWGIDFSGTPVSDCQIPPPAAGVVSGDVLADFSGVSSAVVRVYNDTDTLEVPVQGPERFLVTCIPPGVYKIAFIADGPLCAQYHPRRDREHEALPVSIAGGDTVSTWFDPKRSGAITGTLRDAASGEPVPGARLRAVELDTRVTAHAISAEDGAFAFRRVRLPGTGRMSGLPAGRWRIQADSTVAPGPFYTPVVQAAIEAFREGPDSVRVNWRLPAGSWPYQILRRTWGDASRPRLDLLLQSRGGYEEFQSMVDAPGQADYAQYGVRYARSEEMLQEAALEETSLHDAAMEESSYPHGAPKEATLQEAALEQPVLQEAAREKTGHAHDDVTARRARPFATRAGPSDAGVWLIWSDPIAIGFDGPTPPRAKRQVIVRPTPWDGQGEVTFYLPPGASAVDAGTLTIYDPGGREVRGLRWPAGARSLSWDGRDRYGRRVFSRLLFLRMEGADGVFRGSLPLVR